TQARAEILPFGVDIDTCLSRDFVWNDFQKALKDSHSSKLWPQDSSEVQGLGIQDGTEISVKYFFNFFIQPTYKYQIIDVIEGQQFRYEANDDHPFRGGATLQLLEKEQGSRLIWVGEYLVSSNQSWAKQAFLKFSKNFFADLERRFKELEKTQCSE
ncbi:hypothetical protein K2X05_14585, partial [bacterium]|nr:hypothetical protein [bacterium]